MWREPGDPKDCLSVWLFNSPIKASKMHVGQVLCVVPVQGVKDTEVR